MYQSFLADPVKKPVIALAVHHLSEKDRTLGVAVLCLGSSDNTTKSRKCGCTHRCRQEHTNEEREMVPGSGKETSHSFSVRKFFISLLGTKKWSCAKSHAGVLSERHADFHCTVTVALVKRKQKTQIPSRKQVFLYLLCDFYIPSAANGIFTNIFKKCQGPTVSPVYTAANLYWSGWCTEGAWVFPQFGCCEENMLCLPAPDWISRWPNVWWPEEEPLWIWSVSQIQVIVKYLLSICESRGLTGIAKSHYTFSPTADLRSKRKTVCLQPPWHESGVTSSSQFAVYKLPFCQYLW